MKPPTKIQVGGVAYSVLYPHQIKGSLAGEADHDRSLIQITTDQSPDMMKSTLLHEVLHCAAHHIDWKVREATIVKMEKMLFSLLRDNPEFCLWLIEK